MAEVFRFVKELKENNNREWFNAHKEWYLAVKARHEDFINRVIPALAVTEPDVDGLTAKDCIFQNLSGMSGFHPIKSLIRRISGRTW